MLVELKDSYLSRHRLSGRFGQVVGYQGAILVVAFPDGIVEIPQSEVATYFCGHDSEPPLKTSDKEE